MDSSSLLYHVYNEGYENGRDSVVCGIHSCLPCSSFDWTLNHPLPGVDLIVERVEIDRNILKQCLFVDFFFASSIYVSEDGEDEALCGIIDIPCSSLSHSFSHLDSSSSLSLILLSSSIHNSSFSSSKTLSLLSHDSTEKMNVNIYSSFSSSSATIQNEGILIIERIKFHSIDSSIGNTPFILSSSGSSLSLSDSSFSFSSLSPSVSLISVSSGSFSCSSVEIKPSSPSSFSSSNSLFSIETTGIVSFSSCFFDKLRLTQTSLISSSSSSLHSSFVVDSSNITNIECSSSREGGGMKYSSSSSSSLSLSSSSFHECSCSEEIGRGGGIHLNFSSSTSSLLLSSISFSSNFALIGKDMYVLTSSFSSLFPSDSPSPFTFALKNGKSRGFSLFGRETEGNGNIFITDFDLYFFLLGYHSSPFFLSSCSNDADYHNFSYCGLSIFPSSSLSYLLENNGNFSSDEKKVDGMSEILIKDELCLYSFVFLQNVLMKSDEKEKGTFHVEEGINVEGKEYVMKLEDKVSFEKISFFSSTSIGWGRIPLIAVCSFLISSSSLFILSTEGKWS
jgi:hypothetical protein